MKALRTAPLNIFSCIPSVCELVIGLIFFYGIVSCNVQNVTRTDTFLASLGLESSAISLAAKETGGEQLACAILRLNYARGTVFDAGNSTIYTNEREAHWYVDNCSVHVSFPFILQQIAKQSLNKKCNLYRSATAWNSPTCIYTPANAENVIFAVKVLGFTGSKYAIRSGGHSPLAAWANIDKGILISMSNITDLAYDAGTESVRVGFGNRWGEIYEYLEAYNRIVVGGRVLDVGQGLTIGGKDFVCPACKFMEAVTKLGSLGGLSHLSNQYGFVADNVVSFEVVLATGKLVTASAASNPDLYWSLKGGGNNFGALEISATLILCSPSTFVA